MTSGDQAPIRFTFGPLERRGLIAGWRAGQLGALTGGLISAVLLVRADPAVPGALAGLAVLGVALILATWPIAGRTAEQWAPDAVRHAHSAASRHRSRRGNPFASLCVITVNCGAPGDGYAAEGAAVVNDRDAGTYTAVLRAAGNGFILLGDDEKVQRVGNWGSVLASLARPGSPVHRIQWVARSFSDDGRAVRAHLAGHAAVDESSPAHLSYRRLLHEQSSVTHVHDVLISVTIDVRHAGRAVRAAGGGDAGACTVLLRAMTSVRAALADAGIESSGLIGPAELTSVLSAAYAEGPVTPPARHAAPSWPWPMAVEGSWGSARVDGTLHVTYWVAEWPRTEVSADFLGPLLVADVRRTVSVVMAPVDALEAARRTEQARTADIADAELRRRGGFLATARRHREELTLTRRESELADGHAQYRFAAYVTVTASDVAELDDACARTEQAAGRCGLELRRCFGDQERAFLCTLPLGRGLS